MLDAVKEGAKNPSFLLTGHWKLRSLVPMEKTQKGCDQKRCLVNMLNSDAH